MAQYRYLPKGNRTPLHHPVFGHLEWDGVYSHPECAGHPDFKEIKAEPEPDIPDPEISEPPTDAGEEPVDEDITAEVSAETAKPSAKRKAGAGNSGRSNT